jgi:hypothetical protein
VPLGRPAVVAPIVAALHHTLARLGSDRYEIVLTLQESVPSPTPGRRPIESRLKAA